MILTPLVPKTKNKRRKGEMGKKKATPHIGIKKGYIDNNLTKLQIYTQILRRKRRREDRCSQGLTRSQKDDN